MFLFAWLIVLDHSSLNLHVGTVIWMLMLSLFCIFIEILGLMTLADMRQNWHKLQHYPCLMTTTRHLRARFPRFLDVVLCCLLDMENCSPFLSWDSENWISNSVPNWLLKIWKLQLDTPFSFKPFPSFVELLSTLSALFHGLAIVWLVEALFKKGLTLWCWTKAGEVDVLLIVLTLWGLFETTVKPLWNIFVEGVWCLVVVYY